LKITHFFQKYPKMTVLGLSQQQQITNQGPTNDGDYETPRRNPYTESEPPDEVKAKIFKNAPPGYQNLNTRKVGSVKAQIRTIMQVHGKNGLTASQIVSKYKELNSKETIDLEELNYKVIFSNVKIRRPKFQT